MAAAGCSSGGGKASERGAAVTTATTAAPETTTTAAPTTTTTARTTTTAKPAPAPPVTSPGGLAWRACGALQCASLSVPRDYADPAGPALTLALARKPARTPAARIGSLLINPGGPGDSGVDDLPAELRSLTATLQNRFDIVSWDPRAFVLDGPIDPSLTLDQMTLAQAVGFEGALRSFFAWCDATATCRWRPADADRTAAFVALMDRIRQKPLAASGGRIVGVDTFVSGTMSRLTARSRWPSL